MDDIFAKRVKAAAISGWWVCLILTVVIAIQYLSVLYLFSSKPTWFLDLLLGVDWTFAQKLCLSVIVIFKLLLWTLLIATLWATLWARSLAKSSKN